MPNTNVEKNLFFRGFVVEGKKRENVWTEGRWCDMYYMAILEHEWAEKQEKIRSLMD